MAVTLFRSQPLANRDAESAETSLSGVIDAQFVRTGTYKVWPSYLGKPIDPMETTLAARALSVLHSMDVREPRGLTKDEAIAVLRWNGQPV